MENWTELYNGCLITNRPRKYRNLVGANRRQMNHMMVLVIRCSIFRYDYCSYYGANNPNRYIRIQDAFPTSLGEITMDTTIWWFIICNLYCIFQFTTFEIGQHLN